MKYTPTPKRSPDRFARPVLEPGNTAALATAAATYAGGDPWADRPPVSHGFAKPKPRRLLAPGVGFGHAAPALRREALFGHPDSEAGASTGWSAHDLPACAATPAPRRAESPEERAARLLALAEAGTARAKAAAEADHITRRARRIATLHLRLTQVDNELRIARRAAAEAEANRLARLGTSPWASRVSNP